MYDVSVAAATDALAVSAPPGAFAQLGFDLLDANRPVRTLHWDGTGGQTSASSLTAAEAVALDLAVIVTYPEGTVPGDYDVDEDADPTVPAATLVAIGRTDEEMGIRTIGTPSGRRTVAGLENAMLVRVLPTAAHAATYQVLLAHFGGNPDAARVGQMTRRLSDRPYKPMHEGRRDVGFVVEADGSLRYIEAAEARRLVSIECPLEVRELPALLTRFGISEQHTTATTAPACVGRTENLSVAAMFANLNRLKQVIAGTSGRGFGVDPKSRNEGEYRVLLDLFTLAYSDEDIAAFLRVMPIGARMKGDKKTNKFRQVAYVSRARKSAAEYEVAHPDGAQKTRGVLGPVNSWWASLRCTTAVEFVAAAALADVAVRAHSLEVRFSERQFDEAGLSGRNAFRALRAMRSVVEVEKGRQGRGTLWRIVPPRKSVAPVPHRASWATIVDLGRSDVVQGGVVGPGAVLALAAVTAGAQTRAQIATAHCVTETTVRDWVQKLRREDVGLLLRHDTDRPLAPMALGVTVDDLAITKLVVGAGAARQAANQVARDDHAESYAEVTAAAVAHAAAKAAVDPGTAADVTVDDAILSADDPARGAFDACLAALTDMPDGAEELNEALLIRLTNATVSHLDGDLDAATEALVAGGEIVTAWAWGVASAEGGTPRIAAHRLGVVLQQAVEFLVAGGDLDVVAAAAADAATVGIPWLDLPPVWDDLATWAESRDAEQVAPVTPILVAVPAAAPMSVDALTAELTTIWAALVGEPVDGEWAVGTGRNIRARLVAGEAAEAVRQLVATEGAVGAGVLAPRILAMAA